MKGTTKMKYIAESAWTVKIVALALLIGSIVFSGCDKEPIKGTEVDGIKIDYVVATTGTVINHGEGCYTRIVEIEGHKYIIFNVNGHYKCGIVHAESCDCKKSR